MIKAPCRLQQHHNVSHFDCGKESLNLFLQRFAWQSQQSRSAITYVVLKENDVIGYYSVSYGSVAPEGTTERIRKGLGRYPIPVLLLARLAVDKSNHGKGIGSSLLQDALLRAVKVSEEAGMRAVMVDAVDEEARDFYLRYGFTPSNFDDHRLFLLVKDIKRSLGL